jgi:hypothetical protein
MNTHTSPDDSKHDAETPPSVAPVVEARVDSEGGEAATHPSGEESKPRPRSTHADLWQVAIQGAVLLGALWALSIYKGQLVEMREANRLMKASTDAATDAANSVKDSVKQAREASQLEQRAWVATSGIATGAPQEGVKFVVKIPVKNTGKTFARKVAMNANFQFVPAGRAPEFASDDSETLISNLLLSPDGTYELTLFTKEPWSEKEMVRIKPAPGDEIASHFLVIHGYITYYDIFGCDHWTVFCFKLVPEGWTWQICGQHNDADNGRCGEPREN